MKRLCLGLCLLLSQLPLLLAQEKPAYLNPNLSVEERAQDLVGQLTLDEKIAQLNYRAPAIDRLDIPAYNWWNEALHGVARNGRATVFPQAIALGATWDDNLVYQVAGELYGYGSLEQQAVQHGWASVGIDVTAPEQPGCWERLRAIWTGQGGARNED